MRSTAKKENIGFHNIFFIFNQFIFMIKSFREKQYLHQKRNSLTQESTIRTFLEDQISFTHSQTIFLSILEYCYDVFWPLAPFPYRINMKDCGFTFYDKSYPDYCFDTVEDDIKDWNFHEIIKNSELFNLAKSMTGIGPKVVLREIFAIFDKVSGSYSSKIKKNQILHQLTTNQQELTDTYRFLRMERQCLVGVNLDYAASLLQINVRKSWKSFMKIFIDTVYELRQGKTENKYHELLLITVTRSYHQRKTRLEEIIDETKNTKSQYSDSDNESMMEESPLENIEGEIQIFQKIPTSRNSSYYGFLEEMTDEQSFCDVSPMQTQTDMVVEKLPGILNVKSSPTDLFEKGTQPLFISNTPKETNNGVQDCLDIQWNQD